MLGGEGEMEHGHLAEPDGAGLQHRAGLLLEALPKLRADRAGLDGRLNHGIE